MPRAKVKTSDDKEKRSLQAKGFYSDFEKDNMLYAMLIRSPASTGKIKSIEVSDLPEDYYFFTAKDIPGSNDFQINGTDTYIFNSAFVNYTGEPLGILVGPDKKRLSDLMDNVSVSFDIETLEAALNNVMKNQKRPVLKVSPNEDINQFVSQLNEMPSLDSVDAIETSEKDVFTDEEDPSEIIAKREIKTGLYETLTQEEIDEQLFKTADYVSEEKYSQSNIKPRWQETIGAFCYWEGKNLHVCAPTRWTYSLQNTLAKALNMPVEKIFVHKTKISGSNTNGLWQVTKIATQASIAALLTKKSIKLVLDHDEEDAYLTNSIHSENKQRIAINDDGKIAAMEIEIVVDAGLANPFAQEIADRLSIAAFNYYRPENMHITTIVHTSKAPPTSLYVQNLEAQAMFAIENHIQKLSLHTSVSPDEIRYINSEVTKKSTFPYFFDFGDINQTIQNSIKISDFNRKWICFNMDAVNRTLKNSNPFFALPLRGIGMASAYNSSGYFGNSIYSAGQNIEVTLTTENIVIIHAVKPSEVIQELWKQTVSETLQIEKNKIVIDSDYSLEELPPYPEDSGSNISIINILLKKCCNEIQKKRFRQPLPISAKKAVTTAMKKNWKKESFIGNPFQSTSFATAVLEVELDTYTYNSKIKGIWITIDCGEIFDKKAAEQSIQLELQQELANLVTDKIFTCDNCNITFIESKRNSSQVHNLIHNVIPAAFASALSSALTTELTKLPCTETQILQLMRKRETLESEEAVVEKTDEIDETPAADTLEKASEEPAETEDTVDTDSDEGNAEEKE